MDWKYIKDELPEIGQRVLAAFFVTEYTKDDEILVRRSEIEESKYEYDVPGMLFLKDTVFKGIIHHQDGDYLLWVPGRYANDLPYHYPYGKNTEKRKFISAIRMKG